MKSKAKKLKAKPKSHVPASQVRIERVKFLMKEQNLRYKNLDDLVPGVGRDLRKGRPITTRSAAGIAKAIWKLHECPEAAKESKNAVQNFWENLGKEISGGKRLPARTDFDAFRHVFYDWLFSPLPPPSPPPPDTALRDEYLRWVLRECAPLRLQAIDQSASKPGKEPLGLASVYVDLNLDYRVPQRRSLAEHLKARPRYGRSLDRPHGVEMHAAEEARETRLVPALEALAEHDKFVLLGAPGSGKSTVTAFVALQLARALLNEKGALEKLGPWWKHGPLLPVRVVLRQFASKLPKELDRGRAGHLWTFLRSEVNYDDRADQTVECLRQIAQSSGALFLLDGLDEVRDETTRRRMLEAVAEFTQTAGPRCRFLLTSRPYAWETLQANEPAARAASPQDSPEALTHIQVAYRLAPLEPQQVEAFITRWYEAVADAHWISEAEAARKRGELIAAIKRPDLFALARNPLLLTLMATLHTNRARLPDDRADLYNEVVELLLQRWNETSGADQGLLEALQIPTLKLSDLREAVEQLAFEAHAAHAGKEGLADISETVLVAGLRPLLGGSADKAEIALTYIENRAGLLLGQGERGRNRQYTFPHRTFQEYLAACHLTNRPDFYQRAADLARENPAHWQEVLPLAARHAKAGRGVPAADALVRCQKVEDTSAAAITEADWRAAVLAGKQLLEIGLAAVESRPEHKTIRDRVARWLAAILERGALPVVERAQAGIVLGKLGDPRHGVIALPASASDQDFWIEIPKGQFIMGGKEGWQGGRQIDDCDLIKSPYRISRYPVTVAQYQAFVDAKGYEDDRPFSEGGFWTTAGLEWRRKKKITGPENYDPVYQTPNHPRVGVSWFEAVAFCRWLSVKLGSDADAIRLPSEAQWERAARGENGRAYPWGDEAPTAEHCNWEKTGIGHTSAVGLFPKGKAECGAADLSGNVWEWCRTPRLQDYKDYETNVSDDLEGDSARVLRGASWGFGDPVGLFSSYRGLVHPVLRGSLVGFRVVCVCGSAR